jgi:hypothetical protein
MTSEALDLDEKYREQERAEVLEKASRCWEKFPVRYQQAVADRPDVLEWVRQFQADLANAPSLLLLGPRLWTCSCGHLAGYPRSKAQQGEVK